jgi:poly(ADP-ribose) glycohydrolase
MENLSIYLPHTNQIFFNNITFCFSQPVYDMNSLNNIFFKNQCPFFLLMNQFYQQESLEFLKVYNSLARLVLNMGNILPQSIPILKKFTKLNSVELTRRQAALLFCLSFFGVLPVNTPNSLNRFNVSQVLYANCGPQFQFARCFLNYLKTIGIWLNENNPILDEKIIYKRTCINRSEWNFGNSKFINLCQINFCPLGSLTEGNATYCVDFANKFVGGGVLRGGAVQEEILFALDPEAIVALLFMEVMDDNDAIGIFNTIQYSKNKNYGKTFEFDGSNINVFSNMYNIKRHRIIAIDAARDDKRLNQLSNYDQQNYQNIICRDIYKAIAGFSLINTEIGFEKSISTGNWGCGVFNGIHELKFIEQWIAASFAGVQRLDYYTFNKIEMQNALKCYEFIKNKFKTTYNLFCALVYNKLDAENIINWLVKMNFQPM